MNDKLAELFDAFRSKHFAALGDPQDENVLLETTIEQIAYNLNALSISVNMGMGEYLFGRNLLSSFDHLSGKALSHEQFKNLIHKDDMIHFEEAILVGMQKIGQLLSEKQHQLALAFECRMRDNRNEYCRTLFRYEIFTCATRDERWVKLLLFPLRGWNRMAMPNSLYVIDTKKKEFCYTDKRGSLTKHQLDILRRRIAGQNDVKIGEALCLSPVTIKTHHKNIYAKLGIDSKVRIVLYLQYLGLL